jgi:hypothetical protein
MVRDMKAPLWRAQALIIKNIADSLPSALPSDIEQLPAALRQLAVVIDAWADVLAIDIKEVINDG